MNLPLGISALQHTDRRIGIPICAALTLLRKIIEPRTPSTCALTKDGRILFVKFAEQGSSVLAYPAIQRAIEMVGHNRVYFLVFHDNRFILDTMEVIPRENVFTISTRSTVALAAGAWQVLWRIRRMNFNAVIDLEFFTRFSAIMTFLSGATARVGFHSFFGDGPYRGNLMTHRLVYNPHLHTSEMYLFMVEALTRDPAELPTSPFVPPSQSRPPRFHPRPDEVADFAERLEQDYPRLGRSPLVLLNPNAGDFLPLRRWPSERYIELAHRLLNTYPDVVIGFTGSPDEAKEIERVTASVGSDRVISFAGRTTLQELMLLYLRSEVLVTNDSGPAHFASMTPVNVVTLFGPETPALFGAHSPTSTALWAGLACSPCVNAYNNRQSPCRNNLCMQAISVDQVFATVTKIYESRRMAGGNHRYTSNLPAGNGAEPTSGTSNNGMPVVSVAVAKTPAVS